MHPASSVAATAVAGMIATAACSVEEHPGWMGSDTTGDGSGAASASQTGGDAAGTATAADAGDASADGGDGDTTSGDGDGTTSGDGDGTTTGDGDGTTSGDGDGTTSGDGDGTTSGDGDGTTSGDGDGDGTTSGDGDGTTSGDGDGTTSGDGDGTTLGDGDGTTSGDGDGTAGDGDGDGTLGDACSAPSPELIACFEFESLAGDVATDGSSYSHHMMLTNGAIIGGVSGNALTTTALTQGAVPYTAELDIVDAITVDAWVRVGALPIDEGFTIIDRPGSYSMSIEDAGGVQSLQCGLSFSGAGASGPTGLAFPQWAHVACTYDGNLLRVYINGLLRQEIPSVSGLVTSPSPIAAVTSSAPMATAVDLDRLRIFSRALTPAEVCTAATGGTSC